MSDERPVHPVLEGFHAPVAAWFHASFRQPTEAQVLGWPVLRAGRSALVLAPTGSGKTLAAFLAAIDTLLFAPVPDKVARCRVLYVSPLKALAVDVEKNLRAPLVGITRQAERLGVPVHVPTVALRTGDTPARERAAFGRDPADILVTTPESLYLLLTSAARTVLAGVRTVIVDEVHAVAGTKRGVHLALSLERLQALVGHPLQRIGLSATVRPVDEVARFLGGFDDAGVPRPVDVVDAGRRKALDLTVAVPVEDMGRLAEPLDVPSGPAAGGERRASIWPAIHPMILAQIRAHRSTLVFVNSRRVAERLASALNELAGEDLVRAHHGSIAREKRLAIEDDLKSGRTRAMVATSSLELGIDMGAIDLVVQVEAPPSVASGIQRIGRAGHQVGVPSKGLIVPKYRGDLLAAAALTVRMREGLVEPVRMPRNPLDVLAQQIVAMVAVEEWSVEALARVVRRAAPYADLTTGMFEAVLDMLSGRYPSDEFAELRPRLTWDRLGGRLTVREGAKRLAVTSGGTIPDRGLYGVFLLGADKGKGRVGELDEEMVFELRTGETFLLGASSWRCEEITHDRVHVTPAPGVPGKMPFWHGERAGRPLEFGRAIGALTRELRGMPEADALRLLEGTHSLDPLAAKNLLQYLADQVAAAGAVPDDRTIVVERFVDELGDWRVAVLSPFGGKVHAPWATAVGGLIARHTSAPIDLFWTDDGMTIRLPEADAPPPVELFLPDPDEVEELVAAELSVGTSRESTQNPLFAARFREAAARALLLPRRFPGRRAPLWQQRLRATELMAATARFGSFPIVLEAFRECLQDVFDLPALVALLRDIRSRAVRVVTVDSRVPSPFAAALQFSFVANFMYEGDAPLAERRAQALTVDPAQLRELLGQLELRELLDPAAMAALERELQGLTPERAARHPDGLHDLVRRIGDLGLDEVRARVTEPAAAEDWLAGVVAARRVVPLRVAGEERFAAAEDAARFRDGLGIPPALGLPAAFLAPVPDPLGDLVARYARTHGPFQAEDVAGRLGLGVAPVRTALAVLVAAGRVVEGELRPGGRGKDSCDAGVLRVLRQRSLALLRREVEPADAVVLSRLALAWQKVDAPARGEGALLEAIAQLQGAAVPASELETRLLPARVVGYDPADLDRLTSAGVVVWTGAGALGPKDGRVRLYLAGSVGLLAGVGSAGTPPASSSVHDRLRAHLAARGASFFAQLQRAVGGYPGELLAALWDLVWAGEVTNDTVAPLRAVVHPPRAGRGPQRLRPATPALALEAAGRWSLVADLAVDEPSATARLEARVRALLDRHGVLVKEAVHAEGLEGGFAAAYPVLKALEDAGRVRRGYFVAGCGAAQFALPGAVDRLRSLRRADERPTTVVLAASDPANVFGAALPWPERAEGRKPARSAGATVVLVDGGLAAWRGRGENGLLTWLEGVPERRPDEVARAVATALAAETAHEARHTLHVAEVDGRPAEDSPLAEALLAAGFTKTAGGFLKRG